MAEVAGAIAQPVCEIGKCLWAPIARRINYGRKLSKNWEVLCEKARGLGLKRDDILAQAERSNPQKILTKECDGWLEKVDEMVKKVETIKPEFDVEKKCVGGLCLDIFARIELGKRVVNMIDDIKELKDESKFENGFLVDAPPATVEMQPDHASKLAESAYLTLDMVIEKIRDECTPRIGIWGMGGVGKTTVLKLLNNKPKIAEIFDYVIWVTISRSQSIRMIQEEVGQRLSVEITTAESVDRVARKLHQRLHGKKYLLLLDDVWETVDLVAVGFPNPTQDSGCKVVLTTRKLEVCRKMGTDTEVKVKVLQEEEAREMFYANVEDAVKLPDIKPLAEKIVRECDGLPLALKVVSEDFEIDKAELIEYLRAEGILSRELTFAEAFDQGDAILQALIDASLLEKCNDDDFVKMHDVVRDLVLAMTSPKGEEPQHLVRAGISSEKIPDSVEWKKATRISFMNNYLCNLPESPDCPELLTLLLQKNRNLKEIPETFFSNMPDLRVLDLSFTSIKSLPTSISKLDSLRELVLSHCGYLKALPAGALCKLSQLEVFKLLVTQLSDESQEIVVKELSNLSSLSCLEFDFGTVGNLQHFLENSISWKQRRLTKFHFHINADQHYLRRSINRCLCYGGGGGGEEEEEEERGSSLPPAIENALIQSDFFELIGHGKLSTLLEVGVRNISELKWCHVEQCDALRINRCLCYGGGGGEEEERGSSLPPAIENALIQSDFFELIGHGKLSTLSEVGVRNICELKWCHVEECDALEKIVDRNGLEMGVFPNLEHLDLFKLSNLKTILCLEMEEGPLLPPPPNANTFTNLKSLILRTCRSIEQLFASGFMVQQLSNLEELDVRFCWGLKGMIPDDQKLDYEFLPKLRILWLDGLPEFDSFFKGVPMSWQSLKEVIIRSCPKLKKLPFDTNGAPNLEKIEGSQIWWDALEWDNDAIRLQFQPRFKRSIFDA
ncbi:hypothetical protein Vadar_025704 [Vaccinium darrowii]|uniref:Uncharacterized protein n=1 Tax=Vaccinium darrowii TaxID=229202 RepID=A0ACB7X3X3_9ERIC|nr:hypothetical protein Vadar_025704 [Vaccinium darrowii]